MLASNNPLSILTISLQSELSVQQHLQLCDNMGSQFCSWETLLFLANLHRVTLLWYLRLQQNDLACCMPMALREYLDALPEQTRVRNRNHLAALETCQVAFGRERLEVILLKGAAALADDLYGDPGARLMGDIDLLILPSQQDQVDQILRQLGFQVAKVYQDNRFYLGHHHLPPYHHPEWQVCVEVHLEIADFRARTAFPTERLFARAHGIPLSATTVKTLQDTDRLLHNACHTMVNDAGWLYSRCSLHEWAEWDQLLRRADSTAVFPELLKHAREGGFAEQLKVYALLGNRLLGSPVPVEWDDRRAERHVSRFLAGLGWWGTAAKQPAVVRRYYLMHILTHTWHTHRLKRQDVPLLHFLGYFLKLAARPTNWKRIKPR